MTPPSASESPSKMSAQNENSPPSMTQSRRRHESALQMGPRKKPCLSDPLIHHGRHFGRTLHALCNIQSLLTNGVLRLIDMDDDPDISITAEEDREHKVFRALLGMVPNLEERIMTGSSEEIKLVADLLQKGAASARSDDTKSLKSAIIDWITPRGESLVPSIARNVKCERGYNHDRTGGLLCPANLDWSKDEVKEMLRSGNFTVSGDQWPILLYKDEMYDPDNPWAGLFRNRLLILGFKHIFTSPSSVDKEPKATRSGNARIHGMTAVTIASLAYVATQVRFALTSSAIFSRTDLATDSERFYNSVVEFLEDPDESVEVRELLIWWNCQVFPGQTSAKRPISKDSVLAKLKEKRAALKLRSNVSA